MTYSANRRKIIAAAPAVTFVSALPASACRDFSPIEQDPHTQWLNEWKSLRLRYEKAEPDSTEEHCVWDKLIAVEEKIHKTPATTKEGVCAQIEWILSEAPDDYEWNYPAHLEALRLVFSALKGGAA